MFPYTIDCDVYCIDGGKRAKGRDGEVFVFKLNTTLNLPLTFQELKTEIKSACTSALTYDMHMKGVGVEELYELAMEGLMGEKIKSKFFWAVNSDTQCYYVNDPFRRFDPNYLTHVANGKATRAGNELEEWLKNERLQNEQMLSSAPCEYRHTAMLNYREKETKYNEQYALRQREIAKTQELDYKDKETQDKYRFRLAKEQKAWLDKQIHYSEFFDTKERKIASEMRKIQKEQEKEEIRKEALLRWKRSGNGSM
jgi:hypothetical protein